MRKIFIIYCEDAGKPRYEEDKLVVNFKGDSHTMQVTDPELVDKALNGFFSKSEVRI